VDTTFAALADPTRRAILARLASGAATVNELAEPFDLGGAYRYVWRKESSGMQMGLGGVFREIVPPQRLVATEKFDDAWYPGEALNTTIFEEKAGVTRVRLTVRYESREARDTASRSGMERGMIAGYNRLEEVLASLAANA
jgi:uncharacterized protein YndB with AHSA1/START domain